MSAQPSTEKNKLYYGDNLDVLRRYIADESVDLIYLDPPFNSRQDYNVLFAEKDGARSASQITAFKDSWEWSVEAESSYFEVVERGGKISETMQAFRKIFGGSDILAYLSMMAPRLAELHRVLKSTGSLYLHCDPTASHYLKLLLDAVFGPQSFRSEIIWRRTGSHNKAERWAPIHDTIFFYTKSDRYTWNKPKRPYMVGHVKEHFVWDEKIRGYRTNYYGNVLTGSGLRGGESGIPWKGIDPSAKNRHWAIPGALWDELDLDSSGLSQHQKLDLLFKNGLITLTPGQAWPMYQRKIAKDDGPAASDLWTYQPYTEETVFASTKAIDEDVRWLNPQDAERLRYSTQKPEGLLERIIRASSNEGDIVLDPFSGCGTTVQVSQKTGRRWIGIDITHLAIGLIRTRLDDSFTPAIRKTYTVYGEPTDAAGAARLAAEQPHQFQYWAVSKLGAAPVDPVKKGADRGIDGRFLFREANSGDFREIIFSVKGGKNIGVSEIRDLIGVLQREKAAIGVYISLSEPTKPMQREAAEAGFYISGDGSRYPRVQLLTVKGIIEGTQHLQRPLHVRDVTFKRAPRSRPQAAVNLELSLNGPEQE